MPRPHPGENAACLAAEIDVAHLYGVTGLRVAISGGGSGIGAMLSAGFVRNGADVCIFSRKDTSGYASQLTAVGPGRCVSVQADVSQLDELDAVLNAVGPSCDVLINNAGTNFNLPLSEFSPEAFSKVVTVNLTAVFATTRAFLPLLRAAASAKGPARIINVASIEGISPPSLETYAYSSSKAGLLMLTRHLAARLGRENITVNALAPGPFHSRMMRATFTAVGEQALGEGTLLGRVGTPADACGAALFLASRAGAYVTGVVLPLDGGALLAPSRL